MTIAFSAGDAAYWGLAVFLVLLGLALTITTFAARRLGFDKADEITIVFCGSKKSLASGIPMARVLFAGQAVGAVVLPLMLFHQMQLMVCAVLAQRYARRPPEAGEEAVLPAPSAAVPASASASASASTVPVAPGRTRT